MSKAIRIKKPIQKIQQTDLKFPVHEIKEEIVETIQSADQKIQLVSPLKVNRLYSVCDKTYVYASDNKVYHITDGKFNVVVPSTFSSQPNIVKLLNNGEETTLIYDNSYGCLENQPEKLFPLRFSDIYCCYGQTLYTAIGRTIYVDYGFSVDENSHDYQDKVCFKTEASDGDVVGMFELGGKILVVCKHKILRFSVAMQPKSLNIERITTSYFNAIPNSCCLCGENIVFLSDNRIAVYNHNDIEFIELPGRVKTNALYSPCSQTDGYLYFIPYQSGSLKYLCTFDLETKKIHDEVWTLYGLSKEGGYFAKNDGKIHKLYRRKTIISSENSSTPSVVVSNFGYLDAKVLYKIKVSINQKATLTIKGSFGQKVFKLKQGINSLNCNLLSDEFTFTFSEHNGRFYSTDIRVYYTKIGD